MWGYNCLVATHSIKLNSFLLKEVMLQGAEETISKAIEMSFSAASTDVENTVFRFMDMTRNDVTNHVLTDKVIHKSFGCWTKLELLTKKLAKDVYDNPSMTERGSEITSSNTTTAN